MDTSKNEMIGYSIGTNEMVQHFYSTLLLYYLIHFLGNIHIYGPGQSLINDNCKVISIFKSTFEERNSAIQYFCEDTCTSAYLEN